MAALGEVGTRTIAVPQCGTTLLHVVTAATVVSADTLTVDLTKYGARNIHGILGFKETTEGSVMVAEQPTTAVSSGTLTITVGGTAVTAIRDYYIFAY